MIWLSFLCRDSEHFWNSVLTVLWTWTFILVQTLAATRDKLWDRIKTDNSANTSHVQAGGLVELPDVQAGGLEELPDVQAGWLVELPDVQAGGLVELPVSFRNLRKIRFELWTQIGPLPTAILPLSQESKQQIVHKLMLNSLLCLNLCEKPELCLCRCAPRWQNGNSAWAYWSGCVPVTPCSDRAQA